MASWSLGCGAGAGIALLAQGLFYIQTFYRAPPSDPQAIRRAFYLGGILKWVLTIALWILLLKGFPSWDPFGILTGYGAMQLFLSYLLPLAVSFLKKK